MELIYENTRRESAFIASDKYYKNFIIFSLRSRTRPFQVFLRIAQVNCSLTFLTGVQSAPPAILRKFTMLTVHIACRSFVLLVERSASKGVKFLPRYTWENGVKARVARRSHTSICVPQAGVLLNSHLRIKLRDRWAIISPDFSNAVVDVHYPRTDEPNDEANVTRAPSNKAGSLFV